MFIYQICIVENVNGIYQLRSTSIEFESRQNAEAYLSGNNNAYFGSTLTILEIFR